MTGLPRMLLVCALAVAALAAAGCGNKEEVRTIAETEGPYVDIGELKYQVQISRQLNPSDREDAAYFAGVPETEQLQQGETWFGVFVRVQNTTSDKTLPTAREFEIVDTLEKSYEPLEIDAEESPWAYQPTMLGPQDLFPASDTASFNGPIRGGLLLFKLTLESMQNRPLEFEIHSPDDPDEVGIVDLDV